MNDVSKGAQSAGCVLVLLNVQLLWLKTNLEVHVTDVDASVADVVIAALDVAVFDLVEVVLEEVWVAEVLDMEGRGRSRKHSVARGL